MSFPVDGLTPKNQRDFCVICGSGSGITVDDHDLPLRLINHCSFEPTPTDATLKIFICNSCGHASNLNANHFGTRLNDFFLSREYVNHSEARFHEKSDGGVLSMNSPTYVHMQAILIRKYMQKKGSPKSVLDIGCFDGELLGELRKLAPELMTAGNDVFMHPKYLKTSGSSFFSTRLEAAIESVCTSPSDGLGCAILSHSLMYIEHASDLLLELRLHLGVNGFIYIEVPSLAVRPSSVLLGDQYHYFTKSSINNLASYCGFSVEYIDTLSAKGDLIAILTKTHDFQDSASLPKHHRIFTSDIHDTMSPNPVDRLIKTKAEMIEFFKSRSPAILGASYSASFAMQCIVGEGMTASVIDESPRRKTFYNMPVYPSTKLRDIKSLIIPMGTNANSVSLKLKDKYPHLEVYAVVT